MSQRAVVIMVTYFYILYCTAVPYLYRYMPDFEMFGVERMGDWFLRDSCYVLAMVLLPFIGFVRSRSLRISLLMVAVLDGAKEVVDLIAFNNEWSMGSNIIQACLVIGATVIIFDNGIIYTGQKRIH